MTAKGTVSRIFGNAGIFFVAPYAGSTIAGTPSLETALWSALVGIILSSSRELIEIGKKP